MRKGEPARSLQISAPLLASGVFICLAMILAYFVVNKINENVSSLASRASTEAAVYSVVSSVHSGLIALPSDAIDIHYTEDARVSEVKVMPFVKMFEEVKDAEVQAMLRTSSGERPITLCGDDVCETGIVINENGSRYVVLAEAYNRPEQAEFLEVVFIFPILFVMLAVIVASARPVIRTAPHIKGSKEDDVAENWNVEFDRTEYEQGYRQLSRDMVALSQDIDKRLAQIKVSFSRVSGKYRNIKRYLERVPSHISEVHTISESIEDASDSIKALITEPSSPMNEAIHRSISSAKEFSSSLYRIHLLTLPLEAQSGSASISSSEFQAIAGEVMTAVAQSGAALSELLSSLETIQSIVDKEIYRSVNDIGEYVPLLKDDHFLEELAEAISKLGDSFSDMDRIITALAPVDSTGSGGAATASPAGSSAAEKKRGGSILKQN